MLQTKLAVVLMSPLALISAFAAAQEIPQNCMVKAPATPVFAVPPGDNYGSYVPFTGPPPQAGAEDVASCNTPTAQPAPPISSPRQTSSSQMIASSAPDKIQSKASDAPALSCNTELWVADKVYGPYVPYTGPVKACFIATETAHNASPLNLAPAIELPPDLVKPAAHPPATELAIDPSGASESTSAYVRSIPVPLAVTGPLVEMHPFKTYAVGFKADTLGTGIEIATPLAGSFNLRSSFNYFAFHDPFSIDGIDYNARLHLQSSETTLDWFLSKNLHISPGILYVNNAMSASASVGAGKTFVLGTQTYTNSVDDPVSGVSGVVFPHKFAPLLLIGWGNILPRSNQRLSFPLEIGVAYTGAAVIDVSLNGTACTTQGCVSFASSQKAQNDLKQEIYILNEDLKRYPVFPIASIGVAYRF